MPRVLERHRLLGGEVEVVQYAGKPVYYVRLYVPGERRYATKSTGTTDLEGATEVALQTWRLWLRMRSGVGTSSRRTNASLIIHR